MPIIARTVGGPGAGKTTRLIGSDQVKGIMEMVLEQVVSDPYRIGFVSFTRAARDEAASRAAKKFDLPPQSLQKSGWFRTIHSCCYKLLAIQPGELISGSADDNAWLKDVLADDKARVSGSGLDDDLFNMPSDAGDSCRALAMWDAARNRQQSVDEIWEKAYDLDSRTPALALCHLVITVYEAAKKEGGRYDFCDLLMRYAGKAWTGRHDAPFGDVEPEGEDPHIPVWFHDEMQDCSLLTSLVFQRLIRFSQFAYLVGDAYQAIYEFAGADGKIFADWPVSKEEILPISYRCPTNILACADQVMLRGGHQARPFRAKESGGEVVRTDINDAMSSVRADETTLILARTNDYAKAAAARLDDLGIPWVPTKGGGGFNAPARAEGVAALVALRKGQGIDGEGVHRIMELLPVIVDGTRLFEHGAKAFYADKDGGQQSHKLEPITLQYIADAGCTREFKELVASGKYVELLEKPAARMARAAEIHGLDAVLFPKVRIGTCHSAKGAQAEHVVAINRIPYPTQQAIQEQEGMDAERRVWFVTASRASKKLTIAEPDQGESFPDL